MSRSKSSFIENSKHGPMSAATEAHFGAAKRRSMPGDAAGKNFSKYGDSRWNNSSIESDFYNGETGVNYTPRSKLINRK